MAGIVLLVLWAAFVAGYLVRQQLRGDLVPRREVPSLPWRGGAVARLPYRACEEERAA